MGHILKARLLKAVKPRIKESRGYIFKLFIS